MAITKRQLIVDLDKYFEMGNLMNAITVINNFLSQERSKRARRLRKKLPLFLEAVDENKLSEFINYMGELEELEDEEKEELTGKLQELVLEALG
jgi:hypothetical protein